MNTLVTGVAGAARALVLALVLVVGLVGLTGCDSKITKENYDAVQVGMTQHDVEKLLGSGTLDEQPAAVNISSGGVGDVAKGSKEQTYSWKDGPATIIITFGGGKVVQKRQTGL